MDAVACLGGCARLEHGYFGIPRGEYDPEQLQRVDGGTTTAEMLKDVPATATGALGDCVTTATKGGKGCRWSYHWKW